MFFLRTQGKTTVTKRLFYARVSCFPFSSGKHLKKEKIVDKNKKIVLVKSLFLGVVLGETGAIGAGSLLVAAWILFFVGMIALGLWTLGVCIMAPVIWWAGYTQLYQKKVELYTSGRHGAQTIPKTKKREAEEADHLLLEWILYGLPLIAIIEFIMLMILLYKHH